jgi:hypothetical protein
VSTFSVDASAQAAGRRFGEKGEFILSADRLVPLFSYDRRATEQTTLNQQIETAQGNASFSILWGKGLNVHTTPRVGFDYTIIDGLTLGGAAVVAFSAGGSTTVKNNGIGVSQDSPSTTTFGIAPRIGYIIPIGNVFAFWPRGGFGLYYESQKTDNGIINNNVPRYRTQSDTVWSIDLDPQFVITPVPHFGFNFGLLANIPFPTGTQKVETTNGSTTVSVSNDLWVFHMGVSAGILGYF